MTTEKAPVVPASNEPARRPAIDQECTCDAPDTRTHSGVKECERCWTIRKLDYPAALHWARVTSEFMSNIDGYDLREFMPDAGVSMKEFGNMIEQANKILSYADRILRPDDPMPDADDTNGFPKRWERQKEYIAKRFTTWQSEQHQTKEAASREDS